MGKGRGEGGGGGGGGVFFFVGGDAAARPTPPSPPLFCPPQLLLSAQFLHNELPVRLAHRVAELENLPYGLSAKAHVLKVRRERGEREGG